MTNRILKLLLSGLEITMQCLCFSVISIVAAFGPMQYNADQLGRCFMICILVTMAYIVRKKIDGFGVFFVLHLIFIGAAIVVAQTRTEIFFFIFIVLLLIFYSFSLKINSLKEEDEKVPFVVGLGICVAGYALGIYAENNQVMMQSSMIILVLFVAAQLLYNNISELNRVLTDNKETENFPARQVIRVNMFMTVSALVAVMIGMLAFYSGPYGSVLHMIGNFIKKIIIMIVKFILHREPPEIRVALPMPTESESESGESYAEMSPDSFTDLLNALFMMMGIVLLIAIFVYVLLSINKIVKSFKKKRNIGSDIVEYIKPPKIKHEYTKLFHGRIKEESDSDHNLRVRKIYKRYVLKGMGSEKVPQNAVPFELTKRAITEEPKDIKEITDIYEKARYSNQTVRPEEIERVKNINITVARDSKKGDNYKADNKK